MKLIFISDLHLSPHSITHNKQFYQLLSSWRGQIDGLYILGDFFDYWLGDDDDNLFIREMRHQLQQFGLVTPIYFRGGNHDFALSKKFAKQCKMQLIPDLHLIHVAKQRILLSHGDIFCSLDIAYQRMKRIIQNPIVMFLLLRLPLKTRYKIKAMLEQKSHAKANTQAEHIYRVHTPTVLAYAQQKQAQIVIHGHTHRPGRYPIAGSPIIRYEIPDWQDRKAGGYILLEDQNISLINAY